MAVLIDATIVRLLLVPATMELLGDRNWWLPKWLARILPRVHIEAPADLDAELAQLSEEERARTGGAPDEWAGGPLVPPATVDPSGRAVPEQRQTQRTEHQERSDDGEGHADFPVLGLQLDLPREAGEDVAADRRPRPRRCLR